jgi:Astacin (Peptidase family M12A)/Divergent InlB B-repeat domain/Abnormal spindle-like microcephaly-assoc'd, ASPM-SPD-2-Hydin
VFQLLRSFRVSFLAFLVLSPAASAQQSRIHHGLYRGMPVTYVTKHGKAVFQGDIVLERVEPLDPQHSLPTSIGIAYSQYLWPKVGSQYQIPYVIASGSGDLTNLNAALAQFNSTFANIKFVARASQTDYVSFNFNPSDFSGECEATVGRAGGMQNIGGSGSCTVATILHEMGHTVGLWHEQSRPDRDTYVSVNYNNLIKGSISNFNPIYDNAQVSTLFDYASIMEYPTFSFSRNGGPAIESIPAGIPLSNQTGYSSADIDGIERLYGNAPTSVTVTSNPPGLQVIVDGATVTTPQVFAWAIGSTHTLDIPAGVQMQSGNIVNSTTPTTFYYAYGRWNDSLAAMHGITVTPGNGLPTTPATSPAVTTYTANFTQLVPYAAAVYPASTGTVAPSPAPQTYSGSSQVFYTARQEVTLTATPNAGQNFYEFNNAPFWLPGGLGANPKTFYVPDTGLTVNTTAEFSPTPVYTVTTNPNAFSSNTYIFADGGFWYAPKNFSSFYDAAWTAGSSHTLSVDAFEYPYSSNSRFSFTSWSDSTTTTSDAVKLPASSTTYTANLTPQFVVTDYVNETCAGSININPSTSTGFYNSGDLVTFTETPNSGWTFTGWQYDLTGTSSSQPLTVSDEVLVAADYNTAATPLTLTSLSPAEVLPGSAAFTLTLNGNGFTPSTVVSVNGAFPAVTFISPTQITVPVTAAQITKPGAFQVWADNFPSGAACAAFVALPFTVADSPVVSASPFSVNFAPQVLGTTSAAKTVTFTNTSTSTVSLNSIATTPSFTQINTCGPVLNPGKSCTVHVSFAPAVSGALTGSLILIDSSPDSPHTVALSGTADLPLSFGPTKLAFGTQTVGSTSAAKIVTLTNNSTAVLSLTSTASGNYAITSTGTTCGASLAAKAKCNLAITFTPLANGSINGTVAVTNGTSYSPQLIPLSGTGSGGATSPLTFNPTTLTFPAQGVGTVSTPKTVTVKNSSANALTLNTIAATADFAATGAAATPCTAGMNLAAGATCKLSITFAPPLGATGTINGGIILNDTAPVSEQVIDVKGTAALPLTFAPTSLSFAAQGVATTSAPLIVTLTNNLATALNPAIAGNGEFSAAPGGNSPCGSSLAAHANCTVAVTFTPSAVGSRTGVITVTDSGTPGTQTVGAAGTGK